MSELPKTKHCILELKDSWLTIWFNRPEKRNALSSDLLNDIKLTLSATNKDRSIRGIIFRGKGGIFCAGADLEGIKKIASGVDQAHENSLKMSFEVGELFRMINNAPQVTVSAIEGAAMAGAFGIACASDLILTMKDAKFALTETRIGLTPAQIAPYVINRLGFSKAKKLMLLGSMIDGNKAYELGLADYIANTYDEFSQILLNIKDEVKKCAPNAVAITKEILSLNQGIDPKRAAKFFSNCILNEEGREGITSFFEKRKPYWNK